MRNLKKILALVLTLAMMLSVMVMNTGAVFTDQDQINDTHANAVDMCVALKIINGYTDGSFKPADTVTRAEMCKMICVALNGGKEPVVSSNAAPVFSDVPSSYWGQGYIESCASQGIVAGVGGGKFNPEGKVTGSEAAKMLLVALGYQADIEGFVGASWAVNVNLKATQKGLYDDLESIDVSAALTREGAAQMIWNALQADEVEYDYTLVSEGGQLVSKVTVKDKEGEKAELLADKYGAKIFEGTFMGNSDTLSGLDDGQIRVLGNTDDDYWNDDVNANFVYDFDISFVGEKVQVVFKDGKSGTDYKPDKNDTIYGVFVTGDTQVYNITMDDLQKQKEAGTVRFGDTNYDVAAADKGDLLISYNYGAIADVTAPEAMSANDVAKLFNELAKTSPETIKFVCNDDGDICSAYVVCCTLARVTAVNKDTVAYTTIGSTIYKATAKLDFDDNDIYSGVAKDDIVVLTTMYDVCGGDDAFVVMTKADTIEGNLDGYKTTDGQVSKVTVDGTTYTVFTESLATCKSIDSDFVSSLNNQINESVICYMVGDMVAAVEMVTESDIYAVVEASNGNAVNAKFNPLEIKVMFEDGSEGTYVVHKDSKGIDGVSAMEQDNYAGGDIIKYSMVGDKIKITEVTPCNTSVASGATIVYDKDTKSFNGKVVASDGVLFVQDKSGDFHSYTVRNLNTIKTSDLVNGKVAQVVDSGKIVAAYANMNSKPTGASSDTVYGIVTAANGTVNVGDDTYTSYVVSVDDVEANDVEVLIEGEITSDKLDEGMLVSFDQTSDNEYAYSDITVYSVTGDSVFIDEYDEDGQIVTYFTGYDPAKGEMTGQTTKAVDDDVVIVFVNAEDDVAEAGGSFEYDQVALTKNAVLVFDGNVVVAMFVDVDGDIDQ